VSARGQGLWAAVAASTGVARRKRQAPTDALRAVLAALPLILWPGFAFREQESVWRVIAAMFPRGNFDAIREAALHLRDVLPLMCDSVPMPK
jgi:hypothetical protein